MFIWDSLKKYSNFLFQFNLSIKFIHCVRSIKFAFYWLMMWYELRIAENISDPCLFQFYKSLPCLCKIVYH